MLRLEPKVKDITFFGSDAGKNVYQPLEDLFPSAHHLLCDLHMKDNIRAKLTKTNLNTLQVDAVMKDIFGKKIGEVVEPGLVDSLNAEDYEKMAEELFVKWNENYVDSMKEFILYFKSKKSQLIKNCMAAEIRSLVGLGYPSKPYTQNANECVNAVLNRGQRKCKSITDVIKILQDYVKEQDTQIQLSLMGQGEWQLLQGDWNISEIEFYSKTPTQRAAFLKGFNATIPNSSTIDNSNQQSNEKISVNYKDDRILYPPKSIQMQIFQKAEKLVDGEEEVITKVKGTEKCIFMVPSTSSASNPHRVKINENGLVECDEQCLRFKCYKICSHSVAVAEFHGVLYQFIDNFKEKKK